MTNLEYLEFLKYLESQRVSEKEIINVLEQRLIECNWDKDECYSINDALMWQGYKYRFNPLRSNYKHFDRFEYASLVHGIGKSLNQTLKLMQYLREVHDFRLTLSSMHFIKIKYLIQAGLMNVDNPLLDDFCNSDLYNTYFTCVSHLNDEKYDHLLRHIQKNIFPLMGEEYAHQDFDYKNFQLDMEYLLYTISLNDDKDAYKRINTLKVALNINNPEWHVWGVDKLKTNTLQTKKEREKSIEKGTYYYKNIVKEFIPSLSKIDKVIAKSIAEKYKNFYEDFQDDGYKVLYMLICE